MQAFIQSNLPEINKLMRQYGVKDAYLFGSAAKDNMHAESDIDFLISFPAEMDYETYANNYFALLYALQTLLKRDVELTASETITNPYLLHEINRTKIALY